MNATKGKALAPLLLRIVPGLTFLWAGIGKIETEIAVRGETAALLATMGVKRIRELAPPGKTTPPKSEPRDDFHGPPAPADVPTRPSPTSARPGNGLWNLAQATAPGLSTGAGQPNLDRPYSAAEFPDEIRIPRVYGLALVIHRAANPPVPDHGATAPKPLWPSRFARGLWPVRLAWTVAIAECVCGLFVLVGLLTRASAIVLAGTMLGAVWLTEVGPAIQSGSTVLGFLPDRPPFDVDAWKTLLWQLALLSMCSAVALLGCGWLGFDQRLFPTAPPPPPRPKPMI